MTARHRLSATSFDAIAAGRADRDGLSVLRRGQLSKHLLMLRMVADAVQATSPRRVVPPAVASAVGASLELLAEAHRSDPAAADRVLGYPYVGAWLAGCVRALRRSTSPPPLTQLTGVAAAAAIRAGIDFELAVWPTAGTVSLPSVGSYLPGPGGEPVTVRCRRDRLTVDGIELPSDPSLNRAGWHGLRQLTDTSCLPIDVALDDVDPHRATPTMHPAGRLTPVECTEWRALFAAAWRLLCQDHRSWATQLAELLMALTPLREQGSTQGISATVRQAFGAIALTRPGGKHGLAVALCHELQHAKLNALLDLVALCEPPDGRLYYAPWRADPRPLLALLHGTFAFLGVAEFWQRRSVDDDDRLARYEFTRTRLQVEQALEGLPAAGGLTTPGRRFVAGLETWADRVFTSGTPERERQYAKLVGDDHYLMWRMRNLRPAPEFVEAMAEAWRTGRSPPVLPPAVVVPCDEQFVPSNRERLIAAAALDRPTPHPSGTASTDRRLAAVHGGDVHLLHGRHQHAAAAYRGALSHHSPRGAAHAAESDDTVPDDTVPDDTVRMAAWTGLALAGQRTADSAEEATIWRHHPELLLALHTALIGQGGSSPSPEQLARWLAVNRPRG